MKHTWIASTLNHTWHKPGVPVQSKAPPTLTCRGEPAQSWKGFGGCFNELGWIALNKLSARDREIILRDLFSPASGCGFNYCRLPIGASDYAASWYSHNEHDGDFAMKHFSIERDHRHLLPYIKAAQKHQPRMTLFASPWSPPTWMKNPPAYNYGTLIWTPRNLTAYARYFVRFIQEYKKQGIKLDAVHVQNEPNSDQKFPSCLWTGEKMRDFIRDYLGPMFKKEKIDTQIWAGTIERADVNAWAQLILSDDRARAFVGGVGYQWAGKGAVQRTRMAWPDVPMIQTENECGDGTNTWEYAHYIFDLIHHYVTNGVEAYVYWNMVLPAGGESTWGWKQNAMISVDVERGNFSRNPEFYIMKHFAAFVTPGDTVLQLEGRWSGNALAFRKPDGRIVYVIHNPFRDAGTVRLPAGDCSLEYTLAPGTIHSIVL